MTVEEWLRRSIADADRRQLAELRPALEAFARLLDTLRRADFNDRADGRLPGDSRRLQ
jgi:hypothetical protein